MRIGVFGKIPARRDYVQNGVDSRLMAQLDPWLQASVAESRAALGEGWLDAWLYAPIWRFWLGRRIAGIPALGAMMPSVDGVGRYFPLCVLGAFDELPSPEREPQAEWFKKVEALMLAALAEGGTYEVLLDGLGTLPAPVPRDVSRGAMAAESGTAALSAAFAASREDMTADADDDLSYWWVHPVADGEARALIRHGLPTPDDYATLIAPVPEAATGGT